MCSCVFGKKCVCEESREIVVVVNCDHGVVFELPAGHLDHTLLHEQ